MRLRLIISTLMKRRGGNTGPEINPGDALLMESGDFLLLESGDKILLEA